MKRQTLQAGPSGHLLLVALLVSGFPMALPALAGNLSECMAELVSHATDATTVGELRSQCRQQATNRTHDTADEQAAVVEDRLKKDRDNILKPFTLMAHKPNYILFATNNTKSYRAELFQAEFDDPTIRFDDMEAQFQISLKIPLAVDLFKRIDLYGAYTNRSFWQVYNSDLSSPFRETSHEPEFWVQFSPRWKAFGLKNRANMIGVAHQSNGRGGALSRSWNRIYANFVFERRRFAIAFKPWLRISEDADEDDNPDITDFLGHGEWRAAYKRRGHVLSLMSRNNLESGFERGTFELGWSFPLGSYPYLKGYVQYFRGYGESLIDYDNKVNRIGFGVSLTDWF